MPLQNNMIGSAVSLDGLNIYVSQQIGSDVYGTGTKSNPFASIGAAITQAGSPANQVNVVVLDGATYAENVVITADKINLIGPNAYIQPMSGSGLTVTTSSGTNNVVFGVIQGAGSACVDYSGTVNLFVTAISLLGDFTTLNGSLTINCSGLLSGNGAVFGSGNINYIANQRSGTDGEGVFGLYPGATPNVNVPGVYVSKAIGSDITGDGSFTNPYASFGYAITQVGTPIVGTTIFGMDSETYAENLTIGVANLNISAPTAKLIPATGDAFTLTFNAPCHIEFATIAGGAITDNALIVPTYGNIFCICSELYGKLYTLFGAMSITADFQYGEIYAGAGLIAGFVGNTLTNPGPFFGTITILTPSGPMIGPASSTFYVPGGLFVGSPAYQLPTADSGSNQYVRANGGGSWYYESLSSFLSFDEPVTSSDLASGGTHDLIVSDGIQPYVIRQLWINAGGTSFSGVLGDRNISITDGTSTYATISAAVLQAALINAGWGDTALPYPAIALDTPTVLNQNIRAIYSGGTTDYAAGSIVISGMVEK